MVIPHFFFKGKLSREESASALLATLLEQSAEFRQRFCKLLEFDAPESFISVEVERNEVDVVVEFESVAVLVEAKIAGGSKEDGQLARYYERAKLESPDTCFVCVYLAPTKDLGKSEIAQLDLRASDTGRVLTWESVAKLAENLTDFDTEFAIAGMQTVLDIITSRKGAYFPRTGDRLLLYDLLDVAYEMVIQGAPCCEVIRWKGKPCVELYTCKTAILASVSLRFESSAEGEVILPRENGLPKIIIQTVFRPTLKYAKVSQLTNWWSDFTRDRKSIISGQMFELNPDGWMQHIETIVGTPEKIAQRMSELLLLLISGLSDRLRIPDEASPGFP